MLTGPNGTASEADSENHVDAASLVPSPGTFDYQQIHATIATFLTKDIFFIGAYPKSGTTWLQNLLNANPDISCHGEGHFINRLAPLLEGTLKSHNKIINRKNSTIFREFEPFPGFGKSELDYLLASAIMLLLARSGDIRQARIIGEKTPDNLAYFPHLLALFPRSKFIHIVRDGRDCAVSAWFHNLRINPAELERRHGTMERFVEHAAAGWASLVERGLRFGATHPERCKIVRYEDLAARPHDVLRALLTFLGAPATNDILEQSIAAGAFATMSGGRNPGTEDRSSFLRQGRPENWREHLSADCNRAFVGRAGKILQVLRYHP